MTRIPHESEPQSEQEAEREGRSVVHRPKIRGINSNQSAASRYGNTRNAQSQTSVVQSGSEDEEIEVEGGSSMGKPEQDTRPEEVEQAASAAE